MVTLLFSFIGCSEDVYENHTHSNSGKDEISFKQFISETGITKFNYYKKANVSNSTNIQARTIESEFITDTIGIKKYVNPINNKTTYTFKIYPITEALESKEYYNLVYEKFGNEWNEIIFKNIEKEIPIEGEPKLEESKMVYNKKFSNVSMSGFCEVINYVVNCNGSCGSNPCDGFGCPTGECIQTSISYVYCGGIGDNLEADPLNLSTGGITPGGGGTDYSGIYIPNPYDGEADLNNPQFVLATQVAAFTRTLSASNPAIKTLLENNFWLYPNIVEYVRNNGGTMSQANISAITFALTKYNIFQQDLYFYNWSTTTINKFKFWAFKHILTNPSNEADFIINRIKQLAMSETNPEDNALEFAMKAVDNNKVDNDLDDEFILSVDQYMDINVNEIASNIGIDQLIMHFSIQCAVLRANHPNWDDLKIYWEASKEMVHITLDVLGLVPVFGEVADLTNGALYTIEGDGVNATLSFASAVPVAGWAAVGVKYAVKIKTVATIGTKVKLTWKVLADGTIYFGSNSTCRAQLRKVLGLAVGNLDQAHHIIPLNKQTKSIVQKASKSGNAFHMNEALNGIPLNNAVHNGSHANYDLAIQTKFDQFNATNATPDECYDFLVDLIQDIRTWIANNPNTPINQIILP